MNLTVYKVLAVILVLLAVVLIAVKYLPETKTPEQQPQQTASDFLQIGNLVKNNPGLKPGVWYLIYEKPGSPAITKELKFNAEPQFVSGARVRIEGIEQNGIVIVQTIAAVEQMRTVDLYYYDSNKDKDASGNILCSRQGLVAVQRQIPITNTPIQDTVRLLLEGKISQQEKTQHVTTEYPLPGFELKGANLKNGVLTLEFLDPQNKTGGGSCRVGILWFQIEATAKQFSEVKQVKFVPEELFQP